MTAKPIVGSAGPVDEPDVNICATRKRGEALRLAVLETVLEQLNTVGYSAMSMKRIADGARTGTAALYRRWPDRDALVADALRHGLPDPRAVQPRETLREDLLELLECLRRTFVVVRGGTFQVVRAESPGGPAGIRELINERVMRPCEEQILEALRRGVERGEVRPEMANPMMAKVAPNMLVGHCLADGYPAGQEYLRQIVDEVAIPLVRPH